MSIMDINLQDKFIEFSKPDKNCRVYNPDSVKILDISNSPQFAGIYESLPKVGKANCVYAVFDKILNQYKTYIYNSPTSEWIEIGAIPIEKDFKLRLEEKL